MVFVILLSEYQKALQFDVNRKAFVSVFFQAAGVTVILLEWKWLTLGSHFLRECNEQFFFFLLLFFIYIQL